ncbi:DUF7010 family protein [Rubrivirga sp. IMCC43871]|uniref:DUF7010 family protein n=1 Tax=Rubrivirga sp. IMCC43871 TaxID=3391575 RepID=UPI0039901E77
MAQTPTDRADLSLDDQHAAFVQSRFLAAPIAGAIVWAAIGVAGALLPLAYAIWAVFIGTGMIVYLAMAVAKLTGEDFFGRERTSDYFDRVFLLSTGSALLAYGIAIPFFLIEPTSLPLSVGILTGLMWLPFSGLVRHWVGVFHGVTRTVLVVVAWYLFPDARFVAVPAVIVAVYLVTIVVLVRRFSEVSARGARLGAT